MTTRHRTSPGPIDQERYLSSPEYAELRGINGVAVTAKAALTGSEAKRSLLFWLQDRSLEPAGLRGLAQEIFAAFPERAGIQAMHLQGIRSGSRLTDGQVRELRLALDLAELDELCSSADSPEELAQEQDEIAARIARAPHDADHYLTKCRDVDRLVRFLIDLAVNPRLLLTEPAEQLGRPSNSVCQEEILETVEHYRRTGAEISVQEFRPAQFPWFQDICGALYELQRRQQEQAARSVAMTSTCKIVHSTLDDCLSTGKMVLIEGPSDAGKTSAAQAWCRMHAGQARFVRLQGITNKTAFFRALSRALGVASSYCRAANEMQSRVEDILQRSGLMLVLDESQYTFVQGERIRSRPELVDWIYTALCNYDVPVALIASPLFSARLAQAQRQTIWNSSQFVRRIYRMPSLPARPTMQDVKLIVRHRLPGLEPAAQAFLAGVAGTSQHPFTAISDTVADAELIARKAGRQNLTLKDLQEAVATHRDTTALAKLTSFERPTKAGKRGGKSGLGMPAAEPLHPECGEDADLLQPSESGENFPSPRLGTVLDEVPARSGLAPAFQGA